MKLTRHITDSGPRWAVDGLYLANDIFLTDLLSGTRDDIEVRIREQLTAQSADGELIAPVDPEQEVWAAGVTYRRSRDARTGESHVPDVYDRVYDAARPELFFKAVGRRVVGPGAKIRIRADSGWNVPEPELTVVFDRELTPVGYCAGNDVSSRELEGDNPLYLPQAKTYDGSCALGPAIVRAPPASLAALPVGLAIIRDGLTVFASETNTGRMKRSVSELLAYLGRELDFPHGGFLMTGTGIVPPDDFTLRTGDRVTITVGKIQLENFVGT